MTPTSDERREVAARVKITIFSEELRECLDAAGLSDCGENDSWNYWYQRILKAHNDAVERQIATEQSENAKLRELVAEIYEDQCDNSERWRYRDRMRELGVDA